MTEPVFELASSLAQELTASEEAEEEARAEELRERLQALVESWAEAIRDLGPDVKGLWLVDFDSGTDTGAGPIPRGAGALAQLRSRLRGPDAHRPETGDDPGLEAGQREAFRKAVLAVVTRIPKGASPAMSRWPSWRAIPGGRGRWAWCSRACPRARSCPGTGW